MVRVTGRNILAPNTTAVVGNPVMGTTILLGLTACANITISNSSLDSTQLECVVTEMESGCYDVDVIVDERGFASLGSSTLTHGPLRNASLDQSAYPRLCLSAEANSVSPTNGSTAGGTHITITGSGFSNFVSLVSVMVGSTPCDVTTTSLREISCVTRSSSDGDETVSIVINGVTASSSVQFTYSLAKTPVINAINSSMDLNGGEIIRLEGSGFGTSSDDVNIQLLKPEQMFGLGSDTMCAITNHSSTLITCATPTLSAGSYTAKVHVRGSGLSQESTVGSATVTYSLSVSSFTPTSVGHAGGATLTINGTGFPQGTDPAPVITVCGASCTVEGPMTTTSLSCLLGPSGTISLMSSLSCPVTVSYRGLVANSTDHFIFNSSLTPSLDSFSPTVGGTGGGTTITLMGSGFIPPDKVGGVLTQDDIIVTMDTAICNWYNLTGVPLPNDTTITCRTSQHRTTPQAEVKVFVRQKGFALPANDIARYSYIDLWSSRFTWGGQDPPREGESVHIRAGQTVYFDTNTPVLNLVLIEGALIFEDSQDVHFQAKYIFINNGKLQVSRADECSQIC